MEGSKSLANLSAAYFASGGAGYLLNKLDRPRHCEGRQHASAVFCNRFLSECAPGLPSNERTDLLSKSRLLPLYTISLVETPARNATTASPHVLAWMPPPRARIVFITAMLEFVTLA